LQQSSETDPDSHNLYQLYFLDDFYPKRPDHLRDICLYDFVNRFRYDHTDKHGMRQYFKLEKPKIPNHKLYDVNKPEEREAYFYSLFLLFVPFTDESEKDKQPKTHLGNSLKMLTQWNNTTKTCKKCLKLIKAINDARLEEVVPEKEDNLMDENGVKLICEAESAMHNNPDTLLLQDRIDMLNEDRSRVFQQISNHLLHQHQHELKLCTCTNDNPLHMFVSGVGGTGKSFLIETIRSQVREIWRHDVGDDVTCAVAAPTGLAAYNVGGVKVHRLFQLPIEHEGKTAAYWLLSKEARKAMITNLRSLKI